MTIVLTIVDEGLFFLISLFFLVVVGVPGDDPGEENGDQKSYYEQQVRQREHFLVLIVSLEVLFDGVRRLGEDVEDGHVDEKGPCEGGAHRSEERVGLEAFEAEREGTDDSNNGSEAQHEDNLENGQQGTCLHSYEYTVLPLMTNQHLNS